MKKEEASNKINKQKKSSHSSVVCSNFITVFAIVVVLLLLLKPTCHVVHANLHAWNTWTLVDFINVSGRKWMKQIQS